MAEDGLLQDAATPSEVGATAPAAVPNAAARPSDEDDPVPSKCCGCLSPRVAAVLVCIMASVTNVLSITICLVLLIDKQLDYYYTNENFNYVFMITINTIMLMSNFLILRGACLQQQRYVMAWIFLYIVLVFLENVVGIAAFILAMVAHASAWCAVPFVLMIILDVLYVYCILTVHKYCRSLEGYSIFP